MTAFLCSAPPRRRRANELVFYALVGLIVVACYTATVADAVQPFVSTQFRCQRPFSVMQTFGHVAKAAKETNCDFGFFTVQDAMTEVICSAKERADEDGLQCTVTARLTMQKSTDAESLFAERAGSAEDYFTRPSGNEKVRRAAPSKVKRGGGGGGLGMRTEKHDPWRYTVQLRAKNDSTVEYKGFDGDGFSMCCHMISEGECPWMQAQLGDNDIEADEAAVKHTRLLRSCPLPLEEPGGRRNGGKSRGNAATAPTASTPRSATTQDLFHGVVTKPLHRWVSGPWEVRVEMWRKRAAYEVSTESSREESPPSSSAKEEGNAEEPADREVLGRVVIALDLDAEALWAGGHVALRAGNGLQVAQGGDAGEEEDDEL